MGPGILPETTVSKHNPPMAHLQMPTKALSRKKEAICERGAEALSSPVSQGSFKKEMFQSGKVFYGHRHRVLRAKEEGDPPVCYQHQFKSQHL